MNEHSTPTHLYNEEFLEVAAAMSTPDLTSSPMTVAIVMAYANITTVAEFARLAGVSRRTVYRWMRAGLDLYTADRLAVKVARSHPANVFGPTWFLVGATGAVAAA